MSLPERTDADRERVRESRLSQGLPAQVEDAAAYAKLAALLKQDRAEQALKEAS